MITKADPAIQTADPGSSAPVRIRSSERKIRIALAGNPNSGKTSLFNVLTGSHQHVGNYGGVTVEVKEGTASMDGRVATVIDLPGTYSLSAFSMEERVARDFLVIEKPDIVINVIDATNLERNLYLTVQLLELGIRPVLALNMWDEVQAKGIRIDIELLSKLLGITIVTTVGKTGTNVRAMFAKALVLADQGLPPYDKQLSHFPREIDKAIDSLSCHETLASCMYPARWCAMKLLENDAQIIDMVKALPGGASLLIEGRSAIANVESVLGDDPESLIAEARYGFIAGALRETLKKAVSRIEISDKIDKVLTHPVWAYPIFFVFMWLLFQSTFVLGAYPMEWIESLFSFTATAVSALLPQGIVRGLVVDGIIHGVGGVIVFLPNILILFLGIAILEDTGYMARAAFIMDKVMHKVGLHGKSFIPLLMGMGCNVPAIMAARTLESPRDRIKTILLAPLISCSARLPVYILFAGTLFPRYAGNIVFLFQFVLGTLAFFLMAWIFRKTLFRGEDYPFVMELPPYRLPIARSVVIHMWFRAQHYLKKMGGVVLVFSVIIWVLGTFPRNLALEEQFEKQISAVESGALQQEEKLARVEQLKIELRSLQVKDSYIGRIGSFIEPAVKPLGFDWRGAVSLVTGFVAKEIVVSSMGVLYAVGDSEGENNELLRAEISRNFSPLAGLSFMLFVLLYTPCIVAVVTVMREVRSGLWTAFSITYQLVLAWVASFVVYQGGMLLGLG